MFQQMHHINSTTSLTPMNYIAIECFWQVNETCRANFFTFLRELLIWKVPKVEIVVANTMKSFLEFGPITPRFSHLMNLLKIFKNSSEFLFQETRDSLFVMATIITVFTHYFVEIRQCPIEMRDETKKAIIQFLEFIFTTYFPNVQVLAGRELIFIVHLLSGTPEFSSIWKNMVLNPSLIHPQAMGVHDILRRPMERFCNLQSLPLSTEKKMQFIMNTPLESAKIQWKSILNDLVSLYFVEKCLLYEIFQVCSPDGNMRGLLIRFVLNSSIPSNADQQIMIDARAKVIVHLLCTCKNEPVNFHEFQISKLAFIYEFLGSDNLNSNPPFSICEFFLA